MLDETALRRENFDEATSEPIALADGQTWHFPKPYLELRASFQNGGAAEARPVLTHGREIEEMLDAIERSDDDATILVKSAALAARLLSFHYELSDDDLNQLFSVRTGEPASWDWVRAVIDVATGRTGPKRGSGGASWSCSPSGPSHR